MRKMKCTGRFAAFLSIFLILAMLLSQGVYAAEAGEDPIETNRIEGWPKAAEKASDYVCLLDARTGVILINKGMDVQTPPASLTKIMTTLVALENGNLDDRITMTETGTAYAVSGSSNLYTEVGETFTLRDMLYGIMLASANDMATQVAEYIGGSVENFVAMMNQKAEELGCTGTHFVNACGMPAEGHVSTAHDLALISLAAMQNETFREITGTVHYTIAASEIYAPREITNHHPSISEPENFPIKGVCGGKTGYTDLAQNCLATFAERKGRLMICITLHAQGIGNSYNDTKAAFSYGYSKWKTRTVKPAENEELIEGGKVLTPKKKGIEDCEKEETVTEEEDGRERIETVYYWSGVKVGTSTILREKVVETETPTPEETADIDGTVDDGSGTHQGTETENPGSASQTEADSLAANSADQELLSSNTTLNEGDDRVELPYGISIARPAFLVISVLSFLVLLGLILVIISALFRRK